MAKTNRLLFAVLLTGCSLVARAQIASEDLPVYERRVRDMVSFLEYFINTVGDRKTSARDKDVIISESYRKIFRDDKVQIEDDLETREAIINKDVTAYLKDVDFFFEDAEFEFEIIRVEQLQRENGAPFFKVELNRELKAVGLDGSSISNHQKRFIEINLNLEEDDLKIASIYTTKISRDKQLREWWQSLSFEWMNTLRELAAVTDSVGKEELIRIASIDSLDLSGNRFITSIEPVYMLNRLRYLNISDTRIFDLRPLRSISTLSTLKAENSEVYDLQYLKYLNQLNTLDVSDTRIRSLQGLESLEQLEKLDVSNNYLDTFQVLSGLSTLKELNLSGTALFDISLLAHFSELVKLDLSNTVVEDLSGIGGLARLEELNLEQTEVRDLSPVSGLKNLKVININQTGVNTLEPLAQIPDLRKIYCDNTGITESQARDYMSSHPETLIMINTRKLVEWWSQLPEVWKLLLNRYLEGGSGTPGKEQLVRLVNIDSLDLAYGKLLTAQPLEKFRKLRYLNLEGNQIADISYLAHLEKLKYLTAGNTAIEDITPLKNLKNLEEVYLSETLVRDIYPLSFISSLKLLDVDDTEVSLEGVREFHRENPECLVLFRSKYLEEWWSSLTETWKDIFRQNHEISGVPGKIELHQLIALPAINIRTVSLPDLEPLGEFLSLKELDIRSSSVSDLSAIPVLDDLTSLVINKSPVADLTYVGQVKSLKVLDISDTAVDDLRPIRELKNLQELNCAGTNIRNLKGVSGLVSLRRLDCSNTRVNRLDRLYALNHLELLTCYNSRLTSRDIEYFKSMKPYCKVVFY